jgi:hypothetical protein
MQQYTKPPRKQQCARKQQSKPSKVKGSVKVAPRSTTKLTKSSDAARRLRTNDIAIELAHEVAKRTTAEKRRAATKNAQLERERQTVGNNLKLMEYAAKLNIAIRPTVGAMCAVHVINYFLHDSLCA